MAGENLVETLTGVRGKVDFELESLHGRRGGCGGIDPVNACGRVRAKMAEAKTSQTVNKCPACGALIDVTQEAPFSRVACPACRKVIRVRTLFDHFDIEAEIGRGGMSRVFRAQDTLLKRKVALKILHQNLSSDSERIRQFEREARVTASLTHPNIVKVYTVGRDQGHFYIAMELIEEGSLDDVAARRGGMFPEGDVLDLARQIAGGLRTALQQGLIHRDIKPGNILLADNHTPKIVDFGLALMLHREVESPAEIWATPFYVAPEKLEGAPEDFRSDLYSLGATLFQLLAGRVPVESNTTSIQELRLLKRRVVSLELFAPHVSIETCNLIDRMLLYQPQDRHGSYDELLQHIELASRSLERSRLGVKKSASVAVSAQKSVRMRRRLLAGGVVLGAFLATAGLCSYLLRTPEAEGPSDPLSLGEPEERELGATTSEFFLRARQLMLAGEVVEAEELFRQLYQSPSTRQPTANWAIFNNGICHLLQGNLEGSARAFQTLRAEAVFSGAEEDRALVQSFRKAGNLFSAPDLLREEWAGDPGNDAGQCLILLAGGLQNWALQRFEAAGPFFRAFANCRTPPEAPWLSEYKKLLANYDEDLKLLARVPAFREDADETSLRRDLAVLDQLAKHVLTGAPMLDYLDTRKAEFSNALRVRARAASGEVAEASARVRQEEMLRLEALVRSLYPLGYTLAFDEALAKLQEERMTSADARTALGDQVYLWKGARDFVDHLLERLDEGYEGEIPQRQGKAVQGRVVRANRDEIEVEMRAGRTSVPTREIPPLGLLALGDQVAARIEDSNLYYRNMEEMVAFARQTGLKGESSARASDLAREVASFRERWKRIEGLGF
ncbi:MAG TPA: serine/threonine-protein kinase [Verrucomicrobiales bacterium]|nr:serine/threonine-protein kinase [Verrucomicrobiales bacterium]